MKIVGVIPARMGSFRFPGKPLAPILGKAMVEHVYRRSIRCSILDQVVIATPDEEIAQAAKGFGAEAIMTSPAHERATDRVAEACQTTGGDIVVIIQGDEPMIHPDMIQSAVEGLVNSPEAFCANLVERIRSVEEFESRNTIKVAMDSEHNALYFSRQPIPDRGRIDFEALSLYKQVCVIPFYRENLLRFINLKPTPLEQAESIDMLRILEHGYNVRLVETGFRTMAVDIPAEIPPVEQALQQDPLSLQYL